MKYPIPQQDFLYTYINENNQKSIETHTINKNIFSWKQKDQRMDEYIEYINQWS
jgi:hypothetical protein